jgi:hypothetical protein
MQLLWWRDLNGFKKIYVDLKARPLGGYVYLCAVNPTYCMQFALMDRFMPSWRVFSLLHSTQRSLMGSTSGILGVQTALQEWKDWGQEQQDLTAEEVSMCCGRFYLVLQQARDVRGSM